MGRKVERDRRIVVGDRAGPLRVLEHLRLDDGRAARGEGQLHLAVRERHQPLGRARGFLLLLGLLKLLGLFRALLVGRGLEFLGVLRPLNGRRLLNGLRPSRLLRCGSGLLLADGMPDPSCQDQPQHQYYQFLALVHLSSHSQLFILHSSIFNLQSSILPLPSAAPDRTRAARRGGTSAGGEPSATGPSTRHAPATPRSRSSSTTAVRPHEEYQQSPHFFAT